MYLADIDEAATQQAAAHLGAAAHALRLDVTVEDDWQHAAAFLHAKHARLDVLVSNAGVLFNAPLADTTKEDWDRIIAVTLTGPFLGLRALTPLLRAAHGASVVNVSSPAGLQGRPGMTAYSASKFGLRGLTQSAAVELAADHIRVNSIHPGSVRTGMLDGHDEAALAVRMPLGRIGETADIAALVAFVCSEEATYITGAEYIAAGGRHAGPTVAHSR